MASSIRSACTLLLRHHGPRSQVRHLSQGGRRRQQQQHQQVVSAGLKEFDREVNRFLFGDLHRIFRPRICGDAAAAASFQQEVGWEWDPVWRAKEITPEIVTKDGDTSTYQIHVDVSSYPPDQIKVSVSEGLLTIRAERDERMADGSRSKEELSRQYMLPEGLDVSRVRCILGPDGILRVEGPLPTPATTNAENA